jgi:drug/metabolite transporter (DMT)-like permease
MACIAGTYPVITYLDGSIGPYALSFLRFFVAAIALLPVILWRGGLRLPPKREWPFFCVLAFLAVIPTVFIVVGIQHASSVVAAILINTNPLLVAIFAALLISEKITPKKGIALLIGFAGVVSVVLNGQSISTVVHSAYFLGSLLLLLGAIFAALNKTYAKQLVRKYDGLYVTFFSVLIGSFMLAAIATLTGELGQVVALTPLQIISALSMGIISTAIPWTIWSSSLKHLDVHVAASFNLLIPVFAALYSFLFLTEAFTAWMLLGLILTSAGIYIVQREEKAAPGVSHV